jgi:hypothetical protein
VGVDVVAAQGYTGFVDDSSILAITTSRENNRFANHRKAALISKTEVIAKKRRNIPRALPHTRNLSEL